MAHMCLLPFLVKSKGPWPLRVCSGICPVCRHPNLGGLLPVVLLRVLLAATIPTQSLNLSFELEAHNHAS